MPRAYKARESLEALKQYPAFQNLRAKAECHQLQFRPKESKQLKDRGTFHPLLDQRTQSAWNILQDARANGSHQYEAEELANQVLLPKDEKAEAEEERERKELMESL